MSVGALGSEAVDAFGEVGEVGEEAPLSELLSDFAGAREADMDVLVRIFDVDDRISAYLQQFSDRADRPTHPFNRLITRRLEFRSIAIVDIDSISCYGSYSVRLLR
jgi:hypothetical protein